MAVGLLGDRQAELARALADRRLVECADREHRVGELGLSQREEEIRLILCRIERRAAAGSWPRRVVALDAGVVAGGDERRRRARRPCSASVANFRSPLQCTQGMGVRPPTYSPDEIRDDLLVELPLEVDDVVRDADAGGDTPRVVQVVDRAARPEADLSLPLVVQLHRQADHLVALAREERGGDRGVDAAGHGYDDAHRVV